MSETQQLLSQYGEEHKEMSSNLKEELAENVKSRLQYVQALLLSFQQRLNEMSKENKEMAKALQSELFQFKKNLSPEDKKRIKEFEDSMKEVRRQISEMQSAIADFLKDLSQDRIQAAGEWKNLAETISRIKNNIIMPETSPELKTSPEISREEEEEESQHLPEGEINFDSLKEENLEEKILAYISEHPEGVKVSEMEEPLSEQRMRIGYVCKKLLEEGKITKVDRMYFPLTQQD